MLEKLLLRKFWKIIKKAALVAFGLSNRPILITIQKLNPPLILPSVFSRILKLVGGNLKLTEIFQ